MPAGQRVFIVCDGVGGCDNGEVASQLVASIMGTQLEKANLDMELTDDQLLDALDEAYIALDNAATSDHDVATAASTTSGPARESCIAATTTRS